MHIDNEPKLDFKDVLIRPKRSTLTSRSQVDITREIKFHHTREVFHAVPVIAANMDTTGTFEMARVLGSHGMMTALHKHYAPEEYIEFSAASKTNPMLFIRWALETRITGSLKRS